MEYSIGRKARGRGVGLLFLCVVAFAMINLFRSFLISTTNPNESGTCIRDFSSNNEPFTVNKGPKQPVVIFTCNQEYASAVASSVLSVRVDGGYKGDVAIILEETSNFTVTWMNQQIISEGAATNVTNPLDKIHIYTAKNLFDSLLTSPDTAHLRETPPEAPCLPPKRKRGHRGYFLKTLIYHPKIANRWDTVLFMDACMTIHSPHIHEILEMPEIDGHLLALPDPWRWGEYMLQGRLLSCADLASTQALQQVVGKSLTEATYFTTAFVLFDTHVIREYDRKASVPSLVELLRLYHQFGELFPGDQPVVSVYWYHIRKRMRNLPLSMTGTNRVPYEFLKRIKNSPHVVTAGNGDRPACLARPKNVFGLDKKDSGK